MSNKVFNIQNEKKYNSNESLEVYKDISIHSDLNNNYSYYDKPQLSDFVAYLKAENYINDDISVFLTQPQLKSNYNLSGIAVAYHLGYSRLLEIYHKFMDPHQFKLSKLVNVKAIQNSLHDIFTWIPGERIINPEFGNRLRQYLYEGITRYNTEQIMAEIKNCVLRWEPRVNITEVIDVSTVNDTENNTVHLEIKYTIPSLNDEQYSYSFYYNKTK